jgi:ABC-type uncharacterized transport system permease subunit
MSEQETGGPRDEESLWLVFETAAANIESSRREQWLAFAAAVVLYASLFALFRTLAPWSCWDAVASAGALMLVAVASTYYIVSCKIWILGDRARMKWVLENEPSERVREAWEQKKRYRDSVPVFRKHCTDSMLFLVFANWIAAAAVVYTIIRTYAAQA